MMPSIESWNIMNQMVNREGSHRDTVAERLRRWTANPMCSARVGSNPTGVARFSLNLHKNLAAFFSSFIFLKNLF